VDERFPVVAIFTKGTGCDLYSIRIHLQRFRFDVLVKLKLPAGSGNLERPLVYSPIANLTVTFEDTRRSYIVAPQVGYSRPRLVCLFCRLGIGCLRQHV
jgi:hypothetical protein